MGVILKFGAPSSSCEIPRFQGWHTGRADATEVIPALAGSDVALTVTHGAFLLTARVCDSHCVGSDGVRGAGVGRVGLVGRGCCGISSSRRWLPAPMLLAQHLACSCEFRGGMMEGCCVCSMSAYLRGTRPRTPSGRPNLQMPNLTYKHCDTSTVAVTKATTK